MQYSSRGEALGVQTTDGQVVAETLTYQRLAQVLVADIKAGRYAVGDRLPSVREWAKTHGVSPATATRCYRHLEALGHVQARHKSGMFVSAAWATGLESDAPQGREALGQYRGAEAKVAHARPLTSGGPLSGVTRGAGMPTLTPMAFDQLVSLQHRMTQLYALTRQPLKWALHLANAAPQWYPTEALNRITQRLLRRQPELLAHYPTGTGLPALKNELVRHLAGSGLSLTPEDLLITQGSTEALNLALRAVTQTGDAVAVESPVYFGLLQMLDNLGLKAVEIPCVPGQGLSLEALDYALAHHGNVKAVVVMPSFQNPLGCAMSDARKRELMRMAGQHGLTLIEDDVFGDLSHSADRPSPLKAWDREGRVIYCGSCSKSMVPGFRLGWVAAGRHQARLESLKISHSLVTPLFEQAVLAEFMQSGGLPVHLRKLRERLAANVPLALEAVKQHLPLGTQVVSPAGGWWLWLALPEPMDTLSLLRQAVAQGVAYTPGALFSGTGRFGNHLRLNIGRPWGDDMQQAFQTLGACASTAAQPTSPRARAGQRKGP